MILNIKSNTLYKLFKCVLSALSYCLALTAFLFCVYALPAIFRGQTDLSWKNFLSFICHLLYKDKDLFSVPNIVSLYTGFSALCIGLIAVSYIRNNYESHLKKAEEKNLSAHKHILALAKVNFEFKPAEKKRIIDFANKPIRTPIITSIIKIFSGSLICYLLVGLIYNFSVNRYVSTGFIFCLICVNIFVYRNVPGRFMSNNLQTALFRNLKLVALKSDIEETSRRFNEKHLSKYIGITAFVATSLVLSGMFLHPEICLYFIVFPLIQLSIGCAFVLFASDEGEDAYLSAAVIFNQHEKSITRLTSPKHRFFPLLFDTTYLFTLGGFSLLAGVTVFSWYFTPHKNDQYWFYTAHVILLTLTVCVLTIILGIKKKQKYFSAGLKTLQKEAETAIDELKEYAVKSQKKSFITRLVRLRI
ncbi:hypothetical protein [Canibacter oris]|uniref:Uncharacterized protein n=1 Tax=Canibacter oris TaxID=1365628 RepID=A0A840DIU4_9MICO|nr:hypothetical protein [Canibacter oris]MBB4071402.1 hypothetical protein [Canibacter oris]